MAAFPEVKGSCIESALGFLSGDGTLGKILEHLPPLERQIFAEKITPGQWYPRKYLVTLLNQVALTYPDDPMDVCYRMGQIIIHQGLTSVYKMYLKMGSPMRVLKKSPALWKAYFGGSEFKILEVKRERSAGNAIFVSSDLTSRAFCEYQRGAMAQALSLSGARDCRVIHSKCRLDGFTECFFEFHWKAQRE